MKKMGIDVVVVVAVLVFGLLFLFWLLFSDQTTSDKTDDEDSDDSDDEREAEDNAVATKAPEKSTISEEQSASFIPPKPLPSLVDLLLPPSNLLLFAHTFESRLFFGLGALTQNSKATHQL